MTDAGESSILGKNRRPILKGKEALWLILLFIAITIILLAMILVYFQTQTARFRQEKEEELTSIAVSKITQIASWRDERLADGHRVKNNPIVYSTIEKFLADQTNPELSQEVYGWLENIRSANDYSTFFLFDAESKLIIEDHTHPANLLAEDYSLVNQVIQDNTIILSDLYLNEANKKIEMELVMPVSGGNSQPIAAIILRINPYLEFYPIVSAWPVNSKTAETVLFRKESDDLLFLNDVRFYKDSAFNLRFPIDTTNIAATAVLKGQKEPFIGVDYRGGKVIAVGKQIPDTNWYLLVKEDQSEVFEEVISEGKLLGLILILVLFSIFSLIYTLINRQRQKYVNNLITSEIEKQKINQKYDLLLDQSNDLVLIITEVKKIIEVNERIQELYGYSREEILGRDISTLFPSKEIKNIDDALNIVKEKGGLRFESKSWKKDGSIFSVEISSRFFEESGIGYFLIFVNDISEKAKNFEMLKNSEKKYRELIEHSSDGIFIANAEGKFLEINEKGHQMLGYSREEILELSINDIVDAENQKQYPLMIRQIIFDEQKSNTSERSLRKKDGLLLPVEIIAYSLPGGKMQGVVRDISDRVKHRQELEDAAKKYQLLFDANPIPLYVYGVKTERFLAVNQAALLQYGFTYEEFLGKKLSAITKTVRKPGFDRSDRQINTCKHIRKSREEFDVETVSHQIIFDGQEAIFERALDITEKLRAEKALKENLNALQGIIDTTPLAVITTDIHGKVTLWNKAAENLFGWKANEILGKIDPMITPETGDTVEEIIKRIVSSNTEVHYEAKRQKKDGSQITVEVYAISLKDYKDAPKGILGMMADITEIKAIEESNLRLAEDRSRLLSRLKLQFNRMPLGFILSDKDLNILDWNPQAEKIFGYKRDEVIGKSQYDLIVPEECREDLRNHIARVVKGSSTYVNIHENLTKTKKRIMIEWHDTSLFDENGNFIAVMDMAIDVTEKLKVQQEVQRSTDKLKAFFESPLVGIVNGKTNGEILSANDEFLKIIGYTRKELESGSIQWNKITPPEFLYLDEKAIQEAKANGVCTPYEKQYIRKDGQLIWVLVGFVLLGEEHEQSIAYVLDISDRKRTEEALVESEANYRGLFTHMSNGMAFCRMIFSKGAPVDFEVERVNEAFIRITGLKNPTGKKISELIPGIQKDNPEIFAEYGRVVKEGGQAKFETYLPALGLNIFSFAYSSKEDHFVALIEDITEQKNSELEIQSKQELLDMTGQIGKIGGWEIDVVTNTSTWTEEVAVIQDLNPKTPANVDYGYSFYTEESRPIIEKAVENAITKGVPYDLELSIISAKGVRKEIRTIGIPEMENGKVIRVRGIFQDITKQKQAEAEIMKLNEDLEQRVKDRTAELLMANKELESFSYSVSHDLRAPIRAIDGFSQIIIEDHKNEVSTEVLRYLEIIRQNTQNMGNLVDDLLAFSRLGRQALQKQVVNTKKLVTDVVEDIRIANNEREIEYVIGDIPDCEADWTLLRQVYVNLISNAVKFTRKCEHSCIEIGYGKAPRTDKIPVEKNIDNCYYVRDNGVGFDMRFYEKLFGVFQRLHKAEDYEGTGVGLAIVKRVIEKHGGAIWADSKLNEGTTFYFILGEAERNDQSN